MADEPAKTPIQNKYAQQYADDLAANRKEQGDLTTQIADLQERLEQLKLEEGWLAQAQSSLPGAVALGEPGSEPAAEVPSVAKDEEPNTSAPAEAVTDAPPIVPQPRQDESVKAEQEQSEQPAKKAAAGKKTTGKKTAAKKATAKKAAAKKTTAKKAAAKKTTAKKTAAEQAPAPEAAITEAPGEEAAAEEKSGPPLWQLALEILLKTPGQPCVAREVHDQLAQEHPGRATSVQTVRNNLETLVKKGLAEKSRQQGSAMYTANAAADAAPEADGTGDGEAGQADETAAGKVPAEV
ncbi:BlaI/MecI/CopY family transcriptional regulator [Streptomyces parvus]|uniref:BlaI/MecI/CopY family transcriptional regulator n=1 Tax=Streptomyces parvus TaxID=66428 RepID=UPI0021009D32|nr:BlaI/MecI/CopY family transcriptional regulator [Streptomyces parvus]MCQ1582135.1 BlaI/MecI/CopY family transcriptional regulator [Streptomyces parvus]